MAQSIETVQVDIVASSKGASQMLQLLEKRLEGVQSALKAIDTSTLKSVSNASKSLGINTSGLSKDEQSVRDSVDKIKQALAGLESYKNAALGGDSSSLTSFNRKVISIQSEIDTLGEKLRQLGDNRTGVNIDTEAFQTYRSELAGVQSDLNKTKEDVTSTVSAMNTQQPKLDSGETRSNLEEISASAKKAASNLLSMTGAGIKSGISSLRSHLSKIKDTLTSIGSSATKGVTTGFSKILKYGFGIRSLYVLFRRLRQAIKDSFTELQKSGADFQTTKANVEALKNSLTTLKYQFGAAFEPIFNTVAPALQTLINYLVSVMNTISAFIAKLTGKNTYSKAVVSTGEIAKNTGSAASSAKELNKQLQGFDELNNLSSNSGSGGGGSGGSSSDASNVTYEEADVDSALSSFWDSLIESIQAGDWKSVGSKISEKLTSAMNDIKWDDIYKKAENFGTNLANFLNGLITTDLFSALGTTIAGSLNTALSSLNSFGETFDWTNLGNSIAAGINSFVTTFDLGLAVETFNSWANGILNTLISAVQGVDWKGIGDKVADGIAKIDASGIGWNLGNLVNSLCDAIYNLVSNKDTWKNLGTKVADGINGFFESFEGSKLAKTANSIKDALFDTISNAVTNIKWTEIGNDIVSFLGDLDIGTIALAIGGVMLATGAASSLLSWATAAILAKLSALTMATAGVSLGTLAINVAGVVIAAGAAFKIGWEFGTTAGEWLAQVMKNAGIISDEANEDYYTIAESMTMMEKINDIKLSVKEGTFATAWTNMWGDWFDPTFAEIEEIGVKIKSLALELVDGWNNTNDQIWDPVFELGEDIWEGIKDAFTKVIDWASPIKEMFDNIVAKIKDKFGIHSPATSMETYGKQIFNGIIEGFKSMFSTESIKNAISTLYTNIVNKIKEKFGNFKLSSIVQGLGDFAVTVTSTFKGAITKFADWSGLSNTLNDIKTKYKDMKAKLSTTMEGVATSLDGLGTLKDKFSELKDTWVDKASKLKANVGGQLSKVADIDTWKSKFTNLKNAWVDKSATMKANAGGQIKSIDELSTNSNSWKDKFKALYNNWTSKSATYSTSVGGGISSIDDLSTSKSSWLTKFQGLYNSWNSKSATFTATDNSQAVKDSVEKGNYYKASQAWQNKSATFSATESMQNVTNAVADNGKFTNAKKAWTSPNAANFVANVDIENAVWANSHQMQDLKNNWAGYSRTATFTATPDVDDAVWAKNHQLLDLYNTWSSYGSTATFTADFTYNQSDMDNFTNNIKKQLKEKLQMSLSVNVNGGTAQVKAYEALGGSFYGGSWHDIPQYASGGKPGYGSLFVAGEAGPEIVGHLNGRTEVLNKSQIASTIHSAFVSSMAQFGNRMLATPESVAIRSGSYSSYNSSANGDGQTALLAEQNRLIAEQNQLLMEIASKDVSISSRDVFNAVKSESNRFNNRTGGSPFLF